MEEDKRKERWKRNGGNMDERGKVHGSRWGERVA